MFKKTIIFLLCLSLFCVGMYYVRYLADKRDYAMGIIHDEPKFINIERWKTDVKDMYQDIVVDRFFTSPQGKPVERFLNTYVLRAEVSGQTQKEAGTHEPI